MIKIIKVGLIILVITFIISIIIAPFFSNLSCTKIKSRCKNGDIFPSYYCQSSDVIFFTGIINFAKVCTKKEIIVCENNLENNITKYFDKTNCKYDLAFIWDLFGRVTDANIV